MVLNNKIIKIALTGMMLFSLAACSEKEIDPPNNKQVATGTVDNLVKPGTAMDSLKLADKMSKIWDPESILVNINGSDIGVDGYNKATFLNSKWIITYLSPKTLSAYTITMSGAGTVSWLQTSGNYTANNNISNFSVDSNKAMQAAIAAGLPEGQVYSMDLSKNAKGMLWFVGSRKEVSSSKYEVRKVDAISGSVVN